MHHLKSRNNIEMSCLKVDLMSAYELDIDSQHLPFQVICCFIYAKLLSLLICYFCICREITFTPDTNIFIRFHCHHLKLSTLTCFNDMYHQQLTYQMRKIGTFCLQIISNLKITHAKLSPTSCNSASLRWRTMKRPPISIASPVAALDPVLGGIGKY